MTNVSDTSSYGLGAVLLQQHSQMWRPVAYASRVIYNRNWSALPRKRSFRDYMVLWDFSGGIIGKVSFRDWLQALLNLDHFPPHILQFRLWLTQLGYTIQLTMYLTNFSTQLMHFPTHLSPVELPDQDVELFEQSVILCLPASKDMYIWEQKSQRKYIREIKEFKGIVYKFLRNMAATTYW